MLYFSKPFKFWFWPTCRQATPMPTAPMINRCSAKNRSSFVMQPPCRVKQKINRSCIIQNTSQLSSHFPWLLRKHTKNTEPGTCRCIKTTILQTTLTERKGKTYSFCCWCKPLSSFTLCALLWRRWRTMSGDKALKSCVQVSRDSWRLKSSPEQHNGALKTSSFIHSERAHFIWKKFVLFSTSVSFLVSVG